MSHRNSSDDEGVSASNGPRSSETSVTTETGRDEEGFTGILRPFHLIDVAISKFEVFVLTAGVLLMAASSVGNVIGRFGFGRSLFFAEELNRFLVILVTFAGIGYAARHGRHIRMSAFYDELSDRWRKGLMIVIALLTAAIMYILAWYSFGYVYSVYETGRISPVMRLPLFWTLIWLPLGFIVTGTQYILTALANATRSDVYLSVSVTDAYEDTETAI